MFFIIGFCFVFYFLFCSQEGCGVFHTVSDSSYQTLSVLWTVIGCCYHEDRKASTAEMKLKRTKQATVNVFISASCLRRDTTVKHFQTLLTIKLYKLKGNINRSFFLTTTLFLFLICKWGISWFAYHTSILQRIEKSYMEFFWYYCDNIPNGQMFTEWFIKILLF